MTNQRQTTSGGMGIQSERDTIINQGISPSQMKEIIETLANQMPVFAAMARDTVNERLRDFEEKILLRFSDSKTSRSEAFKDPDFQFLVVRAQNAYARSGDEGIGETLVQLIAERSKQQQRSRLSLSLNEAVEKTSILTSSEFAELSLIYFMQNCTYDRVKNTAVLCKILNDFVAPLISDISEHETSYTYLIAQGCVIPNPKGNILRNLIVGHYAGVLSNGVEADFIRNHLPDSKKNSLDSVIIPCINDNSKFQLGFLNRQKFYDSEANLELTISELNNVWNGFENSAWSQDEMISKLAAFPEASRLFELWQSTPLERLTLTSVGMAIAHANLARIGNFDADLSNWIK